MLFRQFTVMLLLTIYTRFPCVSNENAIPSPTWKKRLHSINASSDLIHKRKIRATGVIREPYNSNDGSLYIELVMVVDNLKYREMGRNRKKTDKYCQSLANQVNQMYQKLNIFVVLVGVEIWTSRDKISISNSASETLERFNEYRSNFLNDIYPENDIAVLLTGLEHFEGDSVGRAGVGTICSSEFAAAVFCDHSQEDDGHVAATMAHEIGHSLGFDHDKDSCCRTCIMRSSSPEVAATNWSPCSKKDLGTSIEKGLSICLKNKPKRLFNSPQCGNGFVEPGEECDCGLTDSCITHCCDPRTCTLHPDATCATGRCCDLKTCRMKTLGSVCREKKDECDLEEYCTGDSEYCPDDGFVMNGSPCKSQRAYCYNGFCASYHDQCYALWKNGRSFNDCYQYNTRGDNHGHCGITRETIYRQGKIFKQCNARKCTSTEAFHVDNLNYGQTGEIYQYGTCYSAILNVGHSVHQPGMVADGSPCGNNMMCVNQKCTSLASLVISCPGGCFGNGICNHMGKCQCFKGYSAPYCKHWTGTGSNGNKHTPRPDNQHPNDIPLVPKKPKKKKPNNHHANEIPLLPTAKKPDSKKSKPKPDNLYPNDMPLLSMPINPYNKEPEARPDIVKEPRNKEPEQPETVWNDSFDRHNLEDPPGLQPQSGTPDKSSYYLASLAIAITWSILVSLVILAVVIFLCSRGYLQHATIVCCDRLTSCLSHLKDKWNSRTRLGNSRETPYAEVISDDSSPDFTTTLAKTQVGNLKVGPRRIHAISPPVLKYASALTDSDMVSTRLQQLESQNIYEKIENPEDSMPPATVTVQPVYIQPKTVSPPLPRVPRPALPKR